MNLVFGVKRVRAQRSVRAEAELAWRFFSIYALVFEVRSFKWRFSSEKFIHQVVILFGVCHVRWWIWGEDVAGLGRWNCPRTHSRFQFQTGTQMVGIKAGNVEATYALVFKVVGHYSFSFLVYLHPLKSSSESSAILFEIKSIFRCGRLLLAPAGVVKVAFIPKLTKTTQSFHWKSAPPHNMNK